LKKPRRGGDAEKGPGQKKFEPKRDKCVQNEEGGFKEERVKDKTGKTERDDKGEYLIQIKLRGDHTHIENRAHSAGESKSSKEKRTIAKNAEK